MGRPLRGKQQRSRQRFAELVSATITLLDRDGLAGATIPRIALEAGVPVGTVYQRFAEKDALLREAFLRTLDANVHHAAQVFDPKKWEQHDLGAIVDAVIETTLRGHQQHRGFLRALLLYTLEHPDAAFIRESQRLQERAFLVVRDLLLSRRNEIRHPSPDTAVPAALLMIGTAAKGTLGLRAHNGRTPMAFVSDAPSIIAAELPQIVRSYLRIRSRRR